MNARHLIAVGVVATALAAAGTAAAQPVNKEGKKSCGIPTQYGTLWIEHGATIVDEFGRTMKCDDGQWVFIPAARVVTFG